MALPEPLSVALSEPLSKVFRSSAFRLTALGLAAFLLLAGTIAGLLFWQTNAVLSDQVLATVKAEAAALKNEAALNGVPGIIDAVAKRSIPEGPGLYFLSDLRGNKLAGNLNRLPPEIANLPQGGVFRYERGPLTAPREHLGVAIPVPLASGLRLIIGRDVEEQRTFAQRMKRIFLGGFGVLTLASLVGGLAIGRAVLKRIEAMSAASRSIMAGDLNQRIPVAGAGDELDGLAESLNAMLERIEQLMTGMKEVSDNIAHDLKTPLNRLRNRAEAALRDPRGEVGYREGLERTIEQADELINTFNALLLIAKLEAGAGQDNSTTFDIGELVADMGELYEPVAEDDGATLTMSVAAEGSKVHANKQLISQAVANLLDNALKYGVAEGNKAADVSLSVTTVGPKVEISVADHGPGISPADRERVLKRFVRLEKSRTLPGTGLGLSLVAAVARLSKGSVRLEDNGPGLRIVLSLPVAAIA
jgi:signal transduction histidine kinase